MSNKLKLEVLTPEAEALNTEVDAVYLQGALGRLGILPEHTTLISKLDFGVMELLGPSGKQLLLCGGGLVEVRGDQVTVLVSSAERREDIDVNRAKAAGDRARQRRHSKDESMNMDRAEMALLRSIERLRFIHAD